MSMQFTEISGLNGPDTITVLAEEFTAAAMEYHRREMGKRGYILGSPIRPHAFYMTNGRAEPEPLLEGKQFFAATFTKKK